MRAVSLIPRGLYTCCCWLGWHFWHTHQTRENVSRIATKSRRVRLEAALSRMITVWHQSTARAIREQTDPIHSNHSRGTLMSYGDYLRSAASSRTRRDFVARFNMSSESLVRNKWFTKNPKLEEAVFWKRHYYFETKMISVCVVPNRRSYS